MESIKYEDLRGWLDLVKGLGELKVIEGAHWDLEIGALVELIQRRRKPPVLLFEGITDYPRGYRLVGNSLNSSARVALTLGYSPELSALELTREWRNTIKRMKPIPPKFVDEGPVMQNVQTDKQVDVLKFPTPKWHEFDGGRYIGTADAVITSDPDEGWVNLGTYRMMIQDRNLISLYISPGKHGRIHREKWFSRNEPMPVAVSIGHDPLIFLVSSTEFPHANCEYDFAGAIKGEPIEVIKGRVTGLPIPARAEVVLEGFIHPGVVRPEGPFGEWTGYYASARREEPVMEVRAVYHRDDPIMLGSPPIKPPAEHTYYRSIVRSALLMDELERVGVPDIRGAWCHPVGGCRLLTVVSVKQRYPGHAKQAAAIAALCHTGAYLGRYIIVVDEDIDVTDLEEVMWAVCTRSDPEKDLDVIRRCWSGPLDPIIPTGQKGHNSRAIIDATLPYEWKDEFPAVVEVSPQLKEKILKKWGDIAE